MCAQKQFVVSLVSRMMSNQKLIKKLTKTDTNKQQQYILCRDCGIMQLRVCISLHIIGKL